MTELQAGTAKFDDEASEGRTVLGASLSYGFDHAFSEDERKQLALLHFFQGFVNVDVLRAMGQPDAEWCLPEVRGLTREAGIALLDRAAEVGLLTSLGGSAVTPSTRRCPGSSRACSMPIYAGRQSARPVIVPAEVFPSTAREQAFVEAVGVLGSYYHNRYGRRQS